MNPLVEDMQLQVEEAAQECAAALAKGSAPMMQLIAHKIDKASVALRVCYVLGGIRAMGSIDPAALQVYFKSLWGGTTSAEAEDHTKAMEIVLDQIKLIVMEQTTRHLQAIAMSMRLADRVQFTYTFLDDEGTSPDTPTDWGDLYPTMGAQVH